VSAPSKPEIEPIEPEPPAISADLLDPRLIQARGARGYLDAGLAKLRGGDLGSLPVIIGLIAIVVVFTSLNPRFTDAFNLVNLASQVASVGIIAMGIVLVLLLGEIDLSIGSVSGVAASVLAVMNVVNGYSPWLSVLIAVLGGSAIGLLHGLVFTKIGVPSFVVTLAGLLAWLGVQLWVLGERGTINLPPDGVLVDIGQFKYFSGASAYAIGLVLVVIYLVSQLLKAQRRRAADLSVQPLWVTLTVTVALLVLSMATAYKLSLDRGVPWIFVLALVIVLVMDWLLRRTRYGRAIFAIGGNIEAARRAGIRVDLVRISVFVLCSTFAALGGVIAATYGGSASQASGTGDTLINAIAAAVIGGTSLFGGRSRMYAALLGALVIMSIANGLALLSLDTHFRYIITGSVLLLAVVIDAVSQRGRSKSGR
jgi:ABC-type xylose transport system permease subunit